MALDEADRWRVLFYATSAVTSAAIRPAAWEYAGAHDAWLTPRYTHDRLIWWTIGPRFLAINAVLFVVGIVLISRHATLGHCGIIWLSIVLLIVSIVIPGIS